MYCSSIRYPYGKHGYRKPINGDLNQYAFLITFIHEMAHLMCGRDPTAR